MSRGREGGVDFTSALYLGMRHGSEELPPWSSLTTGVPAALEAPPLARAVARRLARLQGCEAATILPSTLHLFWDLFGVLAGELSEVWIDAGSYPIARWGAERAAGQGIPVRSFFHHDPAALRHALSRGGPARKRPLVVTDGFCPGCGRIAPLRGYLALVRERGGLLLVDDTQALGIFGSPRAGLEYGTGGGGSLRRWGVEASEVLVCCSLAKALGAPVAALSGSGEVVRAFESASDTRMHCSPPSIPALLAARRGLEVNRERGNVLRAQLARRVKRLRAALAESGIRPTGGLFPVQTLRSSRELDAAGVHSALAEAGIRTVLHREREGTDALVSLIVNVTHSLDDLDRAAAAIARVVRAIRKRSRPCKPPFFPRQAAPA